MNTAPSLSAAPGGAQGGGDVDYEHTIGNVPGADFKWWGQCQRVTTDGSAGSSCTDFTRNLVSSDTTGVSASLTNVNSGDKVRGRVRIRACKGSKDSYSVTSPYYCSVWRYDSISDDF